MQTLDRADHELLGEAQARRLDPVVSPRRVGYLHNCGAKVYPSTLYYGRIMEQSSGFAISTNSGTLRINFSEL